LVPGNCYFVVNFYESDPPLVVPSIRTCLFVGQETHEGQRLWVFCEPPSPRPPEDADEEGEEEKMLIAFEDHQLCRVLDLRGLVRKLGGLIDFHPLLKPPEPTSPPRLRATFPELAPQIARLLGSDEWSWVTITIKYTDDGFSVTPSPDKIEWNFHPEVKTEGEREAKIRSIFAERGTPPFRDYTFNAGQVRSLAYALPRDEAGTVALCSRLLSEVYEMREDDELVFSFQKK
jgi:hypothetical protein